MAEKNKELKELIINTIEAYLKDNKYQQAYDYIDSTKLYDDLRGLGLNRDDVIIDSNAWKDLILDTLVDNNFQVVDDKGKEYIKSICKQLGLNQRDNPFLGFFADGVSPHNYVFEDKDIIAINNAYSRRIINDNDLRSKDKDKYGKENILWNIGWYKNNDSSNEMLKVIENYKDFDISSQEDLTHLYNIFFDESGNVRNWSSIEKDLTKHEAEQRALGKSKDDTDKIDRMTRTLNNLNKKDRRDFLKNQYSQSNDKELSDTLDDIRAEINKRNGNKTK